MCHSSRTTTINYNLLFYNFKLPTIARIKNKFKQKIYNERRRKKKMENRKLNQYFVRQSKAEVKRGTHKRKINKYNFIETKSIVELYLN